MGFCLFNNVAVAAAAAIARGLSRVAIVDIDVHHGNGSQWMFYSDPKVLYVSTHQFPFYPGTGGDGEGFTFNVPLEAGATDADYVWSYLAIANVLMEYSPELLLISAGYDAHADDPLASMRVSTAGYAAIIRILHGTAGRIGCPIAQSGEDRMVVTRQLRPRRAARVPRGKPRRAAAREPGRGDRRRAARAAARRTRAAGRPRRPVTLLARDMTI